MKTTNNSFLQQLNKQEVKHLTSQVAETIAKDNATKNHFTSMDLWNIQKQRRVHAVRN